MSDVSNLKATFGLPAAYAGRGHDWAAIEGSLEVSLPADYKELMGALGGGYVDGYLYVLEPGCPNRFYDLARLTEERTEALDMLWSEGEARPRRLMELGGRLVPWATTDNGEYLYWHAVDGLAPEDWPTLINEARGEEWEFFEPGCVAVLRGLLSREFSSEILSSSFPSTPHLFQSFADL